MTSDIDPLLDLVSGEELRREYRIRNSPWFFKTVTKPHVTEHIQEG